MKSIINLFKNESPPSKYKTFMSNNEISKGIDGENSSNKKISIKEKTGFSNNTLNSSIIQSNLNKQIFEWNKNGSSEEFESFLKKLINQEIFEQINWHPLSLNLSTFLDESNDPKFAFIENVIHIIDDYHVQIGSQKQILKKFEEESRNVSSNIPKFKEMQMKISIENAELKSKNKELNESLKMITEEYLILKLDLANNIKEIEFLKSSNKALGENIKKQEKKHSKHLEKLMQNLIMSSSELNDIRNQLIKEKLNYNQLSVTNKSNLLLINELQEKSKAITLKYENLETKYSNSLAKEKLSLTLDNTLKKEKEENNNKKKNDTSENILIHAPPVKKPNNIYDICSTKLKHNISIQIFLENNDHLSLLTLSKSFYKDLSCKESFWKSIILNIIRSANSKYNKISLEKSIHENSIKNYNIENEIKENKEKMNELNSYIDLFLIKNQKLTLFDNNILEEAKYFIVTGKIEPPPQMANKSSGGILASIGFGSFLSNPQKEGKNEEKESPLFFNKEYDPNLNSENVNELLKKAIKGFSGNPEKTNN